MWDLIVSVPDHCLSFYFAVQGYARNTHRNINNDLQSLRRQLDILYLTSLSNI